jgi:nicotinate-nucleotide adenylyltransferase
MKRVGILGGTFDPIHLGHLIPAEYAFDYLKLDRLLLIPSAAPVHRPKHNPASPRDRLRMCQLAVASIPGFEVSDIEVARAEPSYTILTLTALSQTLPPGTEVYLLVGEDNLPLLHTWQAIADIVSLARIAVLPRPHDAHPNLAPLEALIGEREVRAITSRLVPGPLVPISATLIRNRVRSGQPIAGLVPRSVADFIAASRLYV